MVPGLENLYAKHRYTVTEVTDAVVSRPHVPLRWNLSGCAPRHKKELEALFKEFGDQSWHGLSTTEAIEAAGFEKSLHGRYYWSASAIAHGQAHAMVRI